MKKNPDQTDTPAFKKWFGDSKVVDAEGKPLVVYHGSRVSGFETFDLSKIDAHHVGFFFTSNLKMAQTYTPVNDDALFGPQIGRAHV